MKRLLFLLLPACIAVPEEQAPMCATTSDCDHANGEICDDGVCWGNPPAGTFSAIVTPPPSRTNLSPRELQDVAINLDGWIDQLQLEKPLTYRASLICQAPIMCDPSMATTITVTRPSTFPGGPGFRTSVKTKGTEPFTIAVPPPHDVYDLAATYTITIVPDGRDEMGSTATPAQLLPPLRTQLTIDGNVIGKVIELGGMGLPTISGVIKNEAGTPQPNYRVVAIGRWDYTSTPTEVSTVDFTGTDGTFQIQLSGGLVQEVELVAIPKVQTVRPTLHYKANIAQTGLQNLTLQWPTGIGVPQPLEVPVKAVEGNGEVKPARGARVIISSRAEMPNGEATYVAEATTNDQGRATLSILDGAAFTAGDGYRISIVSGANSTAGVMYDQPFSIVQPIPEKQLKTRVALRGIVQLEGKPIKDMSVTARPSLKFLWSLEEGPQEFVSAIPPSVSVTPDSGEFVVWVDPFLGDIWGNYDLVFEAASGSLAPNLVKPYIEIPRITNQTTVPLGVYNLATPAYVRSVIVDDRGNPLDGAELKLYKTEDFGALCREVTNPPMNCMTLATTATLISRGASDEDGEAHLTLPR
jgi:hypothetical protein